MYSGYLEGVPALPSIGRHRSANDLGNVLLHTNPDLQKQTQTNFSDLNFPETCFPSKSFLYLTLTVWPDDLLKK